MSLHALVVFDIYKVVEDIGVIFVMYILQY